MNVKNEIEKFASEENKPILSWLFSRYHMESQWHFVAKCNFVRYGVESYKVNRVWTPTIEGVVLYNALCPNK